MRTKRQPFDASAHWGSIWGLSFCLVLLDVAWAQAANQPAGELLLEGSFSAGGSCHGSSMGVTISDDISLTLTTYVRYEVYLDQYNHLNVGKQLEAHSSASVSGGGTESTSDASTSWTYSLTPDFKTTNAWGAVNLDLVRGRGTAWVGASKLPTLMSTDDSGETSPNPSTGAATALVQASDQIPYPEITFPTNGTAWTRTISSATNVVVDLMTPAPKGSASYTATVQYRVGVPQWEAVIQPNPEGSGLPPYTNWLPVGGTSEDKPGSGLAVRAFVRGKLDPNAIPPLAHYTFELSDVSREPGVCMNYPRHSQTPSEGDTPAPFDLQIAPGDSVMVSADGQHAETVGVIQESGVGILCYDYGAYGKLKVTAETTDGQTLVAYVDGHNDQYFLSIPQDENQNHVADAWEKDQDVFDRNLDAKWEGTLDPKFAGQALDGDGISLYEKYRGFFVLLDTGIQLDQPYVPLDQLHQRLDPKLKYLFVYNPDNLVREIFQSADGMPENYPGASSCQVRYVASSGWTGPGAFKDKKRVVNFNYTKDKHVVDQHALYVTVNPSKNPYDPSKYIELLNSLGAARVAEPVKPITEGCTYPDESAPAAFWPDHLRPASTFQVEIYAANVTNYLFDCVKYHSGPECSAPCDDAKLTGLATNYLSNHPISFQTKYTIELSATIAHEMGHGTGVEHHHPDHSDPKDADLANCTMRYYDPKEFPTNLNDRFELDVNARGHNPSFFCRKTFNCWGQLHVTDNPDASKGASPAAWDAVTGSRQAGLMVAHTATAAHLQAAARASNPLDDEVLGLDLSADLDWPEMVAGDPLRLWVRLHGATSLVASNWIDGLQMNLYRVSDSGPRELVLGPERWPGFLQPLWFDMAVLRATNVTRLREWLVAPEVASLNAGKYALEIAWNGSPLAPPSLLPTNGIVSAPPIEFEVQAATNAVLQALNHRHLAWYHYLTDDSVGVLEHAREADRLDPDTLDPLAIQTRLMRATAAVAQGAPLEAAEVLDGLRRRLSVGNCHAAEVAFDRFSLLAPSLRMIERPSANLPVRLEITGLPGNTYVLQSSADLGSWTSISTNVPTTNRFEVLDSSGTAGGRRYYRVLWNR